jgi:hypothetical protein
MTMKTLFILRHQVSSSEFDSGISRISGFQHSKETCTNSAQTLNSLSQNFSSLALKWAVFVFVLTAVAATPTSRDRRICFQTLTEFLNLKIFLEVKHFS